MGSFFPPPPFSRGFVLRTSLVWIFLRVAVARGGTKMLALYAELEGAARPASPLIGSPWLGALVGTVVVIVVLADMARRSELLFLSNLGWSPRRLATGSLLVCGVLEAVLQVAVAW